jgi:transposase
MTLKSILSSTKKLLFNLSKVKVIELLMQLQKDYKKLELENAELKAQLQKKKVEEVNKIANKPSSKHAEWEKITPINKSLKNKKPGKRKARKGSGNKIKENLSSKVETEKVDICNNCGKNLKNSQVLNSKNKHTVEDILEPVETTEIITIIKEKKYCNGCQQVTTAKSKRALPGADIGLNATVLICYLWVSLCLPFTKIANYLASFFGLKISTSGLSKHVIMVSKAMKDVHDEILQDVQIGVTLFADETGWHVKGKNWWLWVFGTKTTAYFTMDKSRGSDVVRRVLGEIFLGVLVIDGWSAYLSLICEKQTCMAHIFRKIKKLRDAFPQLISIGKFYIKLRRIILDGEKLQKQREKLGNVVFQRRLLLLHKRLEQLVQWNNPNEILQEIIKKVVRQQPRILTFVEHDAVPSDNNYAERLIRIGVLKRKVSGGSMSAEGANAYAVLLSIYVTCKLRKISFRKYLKNSLAHYANTGKPMLLNEYEKEVSSESSKFAEAA